VSLGRSPGTSRYSYASTTVRGGRRDAQRAAAKLVNQASDGQVAMSADTLGELLNRWLTHLEGLGRAPKTVVEHRRMAAEVREGIGWIKLRKLRGADLDAFYSHLREKGLSPSSVRRYHAVLSAALHQAVRWGLLERSPAVQATPPPVPVTEPACPTPDEVRQLIELAATHDAQLSALLFVAASTGCRRGELCGLRWSDVDLETGQLVIRRAISDVPGQLEVRTTKTGRARRMAIDPATVAILQTQRARAELTSGAVSSSLDADAYVWSQSPDHREPWRPGRVTAAFIRVREEAGLSSIRLHHLRHFSASVMLAGGVDVRTTAGRLGHSQPAVTLKTYAHVMEASDRDAAMIVGLSIAEPYAE